MINPQQAELIESQGASIWVGSSFRSEVEIVRLSGVRVSEDKRSLYLFLPEIQAGTLLLHVTKSPWLSFLCSSITTFEALQVKGHYLEHWVADSTGLEHQKAYLQGFGHAVTSVGLKAGHKFNNYAGIPLITIKMEAHEIYDQTPRTGAGRKLG